MGLAVSRMAVGTALLMSLATPTMADESDAADYFADLPVVLTVTRLPQNALELPASLTIIDRQMIDASGANDVPDLLRLVAGFQVGHVNGTRSTVTYHGISDEYARRIQVLIDGRSIYMPANGGVDWADIPLALEDIDHIEVLRGPNGEAFGANSFMGVVNIITQHAATARGDLAKLTAGDGNYRRALLRHGDQAGDLDYRFTLESESDNGFDDANIGGGVYSQRDDKRSTKLSFRGDYRAGINDYLNVAFGANSGPRGQGYDASGHPEDVQVQPATEGHNWRHFEQLKWRRLSSSDDEYQVQVYHNYTDSRALVQTALLSQIFGVDPAVIPAVFGYPDQSLTVDQHVFAERYDVEFENRFRVNEAVRMVWGAEARYDKVLAEGYLSRPDAVKDKLSRLFAHGEWRPAPAYLVNVGAMVEQNDITGTHVSPRLAVNRTLAPGHAMRIGVTQAYRTPAVLEEYADYAARYSSDGTVFDQLWKSSGDLQPEKITSYEWGFMGDVGRSRVQYDVKLFREMIDNVISHPTDYAFTERYSALASVYPGFAQAIVFTNRDVADLEGVEAQLKLHPDPDTMLSIGYSQVHAHGTITADLNPDYSNNLSRYVPSQTVSFLLDRNLGGGWRGSMTIYHIDHIKFWHDARVTTLDLRIAKQFVAAGHEGNVALVARDVNNNYFDFQDEIVIGPRLYLSAEYRF